MRQRGSRRVRPRPASNDRDSIVDSSSMLEPTSRSDQLPDAVVPNKYSDVDENDIEVRAEASNDDAAIAAVAAAREYLHCLNERRTKSERYFLQQRKLYFSHSI